MTVSIRYEFWLCNKNSLYVKNRPATKLVILKVCNIKYTSNIVYRSLLFCINNSIFELLLSYLSSNIIVSE